MSPVINSRVLLSPLAINNVRFKYQNRSGGGSRKTPTYENDEEDSGDLMEEDNADHNLLEDK